MQASCSTGTWIKTPKSPLFSAAVCFSITPQVAAYVTELSPHLGDLLRRRRSGVVAALAAAAARAGPGPHQAALVAALSNALGQLAQWQGRTGGGHRLSQKSSKLGFHNASTVIVASLLSLQMAISSLQLVRHAPLTIQSPQCTVQAHTTTKTLLTMHHSCGLL